MLGVALGAFTQGLSQGIDMRGRLDEARNANRLRKNVTGITQGGKAEYDAAVASGKEQPDNFEAFYANHLVPKIQNEYLVAGDPTKAAAWGEWAEGSSAKKASKLFSSGLRKLQLGETQSGIDDMTKAANTNGYGLEGKMTAAEYFDEAAGAVTGYRLSFVTKDGKTHTKNVATEDLPQFFASTINPQAAFEMEQGTKAARGKADLEVETHGRKKAAEAALGVGGGALTQAQYQNAIQEERKRIEDSALTDKEVGGMSNDEKEALARDIVDKRFGKSGGGAAAAGPTVTVDPETGEQVKAGGAETPATDAAQPPPTEPTDEDLGVDAMPTSSVAPAAPAAANGASAPTPAAATGAPGNNQQAYLDQARQALKQGANAQQIGQALVKAGIPPEQWPQDLQLAARTAQLGIQGR